MSQHTIKAGQPADIPYEEQKRIILDAIQQRYRAVKFSEWPYYEVGRLLNTHEVNTCPIAHYQDFFTQLLLWVAQHNLTDSFYKEVGSVPMNVIENLSNFFLFLGESNVYPGFVDYFHLSTSQRVDEETMAALAMDYLYGPVETEFWKLTVKYNQPPFAFTLSIAVYHSLTHYYEEDWEEFKAYAKEYLTSDDFDRVMAANTDTD